MAQKCVIGHQERKSHYREYKETLESPVPSDPWIWFPQTCSYIPTSVWKTDSWFFGFFFLSGGAVVLVVFAAQLTLGQSVLQSQADAQTGSLLKRLRRGCLLPQGGFGWQFDDSQAMVRTPEAQQYRLVVRGCTQSSPKCSL